MEAKNGSLTSEATEALRAAETIVSIAEEGDPTTQEKIPFEDALQKFHNSEFSP